MDGGLQTRVQDALREELRGWPYLGYKEKRMLQQGDLAGIERLLAKHSRTLRRSLWLDALVQPPLVFAIFWGTFADLIAADLRWAFAGRLLIALGALAFALGVRLKLGLEQLRRTERALAYVQLLNDERG